MLGNLPGTLQVVGYTSVKSPGFLLLSVSPCFARVGSRVASWLARIGQPLYTAACPDSQPMIRIGVKGRSVAKPCQ